ncbi:hypothetical protein ZIOFF_067959 [Zingiber officinale]|uniref:Uncharacterized protein n=1 Tax=Zingiber officinale TaxID=94328 RepID=A0A8J5CGF2_ZINOF|nr:hypothetical protein ZIOFF_067959 [Zingiber officinale]
MNGSRVFSVLFVTSAFFLLVVISATPVAMASGYGSKVSRRILITEVDHINYEALQPETTPCSQKGASQSNCHPGVPANPYSRGCSNISGCDKQN